MVNVYAKGGPKHSPNNTCTAVKLYLNDNLVGTSAVGYSTEFTASMEVVYKPGVLKAVCMAGEQELASTQYQTAGSVSRLELVADRSLIQHSRDDLSFVTVHAVDAHGILVLLLACVTNVSTEADVPRERLLEHQLVRHVQTRRRHLMSALVYVT